MDIYGIRIEVKTLQMRVPGQGVVSYTKGQVFCGRDIPSGLLSEFKAGARTVSEIKAPATPAPPPPNEPVVDEPLKAEPEEEPYVYPVVPNAVGTDANGEAGQSKKKPTENPPIEKSGSEKAPGKAASKKVALKLNIPKKDK